MAKKALNFENALQEMEGIVVKLESGELSLDKALQAYQRGVELSRFCREKLNTVRAAVEMITDDEGERKIFDEVEL